VAGPGSLVRSIRGAHVAAAALAWLLAWGLLVGVVVDQGGSVLARAREGWFGCGGFFLDDVLPFFDVASSPAGAALLLVVVPGATLLPLALGARRSMVLLYGSAAVAALSLVVVVSGVALAMWLEAGRLAGPEWWRGLAFFHEVTLPALMGVGSAAALIAAASWVRLSARLLRLRRGCLGCELGRATVVAAVPAVVAAIAAFLHPGSAVQLPASTGLLVPPAWAATGTLLPLAIGCALAVRLQRPRSMAA
jgi:hypothetical protein